MELASTHSSPLLPHKPRDMHLSSSAHAPGNVVHCFSGFLSHLLPSRSKKNYYSARLSHRLLPKTNKENRLFLASFAFTNFSSYHKSIDYYLNLYPSAAWQTNTTGKHEGSALFYFLCFFQLFIPERFS